MKNYCIIIGLLFGFSCSYSQTFIDKSFDDFSKGKLDASGQNLYVSKKGEVRTIHRYDLNNDGFIDLLFNSTHDHATDVFPTLTYWSGNRDYKSIELDVLGSLSAEVVDLNKDGHYDIIFCPNHTGLQHPRKFISIAWGAENGFSNMKTNGMLPVYDPLSIKIADINHDGWPDIVTLNKTGWQFGQPSGNILRVYWGGLHGFRLDNFKDWGIEKASSMTHGDFDGDGYVDIAVANDLGEVYVLNDSNLPTLKPSLTFDDKVTCINATDLNNDGLYDFVLALSNNSLVIKYSSLNNKDSKTETLNNVTATSINFGDLDNDGNKEIIITNFSIQTAAQGEMVGGSKLSESGIKIFWGNKNQFNPQTYTTISIPYAINSRVGDFDNDGRQDLAVAVFQQDDSYDTYSYVYFGNGDRTISTNISKIKTHGAHDLAVVPHTNGDQLVFNNSTTGTTNENVPLLLYWGKKEGFDVSKVTKIPFSSGYESTATDINADGFVDLISINSMHGGNLEDRLGGANIFMGNIDGFKFDDLKSRIVLHEIGATTSNVADINKDGYLDLILGFFDRPDGLPTEIVIYYGDNEGFNVKNRISIPCEGRSSSPMIADFNNDGYLDIALSSYSKDLFRVFWGSKDGFNPQNKQEISMIGIIDIEVADLNNDGFLDVIICHYKDKINNHHDTGISILWGDLEGFKPWNSQWLPTYTALGPVVADFDKDGHLDIFCPGYHGDVIRGNIAMYLYWGSPNGFSKKNRTTFIGDSGTDALAADFNQDGLLDLAVAHHTTQANHNNVESKIYYNDGKRFTSDNLQFKSLPSVGTHWMWNKDMGHIYHRKWEQIFESRIFIAKKEIKKIHVDVDAEIPSLAELELEIRTAKSFEEIQTKNWNKLSDYKSNSIDKLIQYRTIFKSKNGDSYPVLKEVKLSVN